MRLYDESEIKKKNEKNKKIKMLISTGIVLTIILIIALMVIIFYLVHNPNKITVFLNNKSNVNIESMLIVETADDGNTEMYLPIREISGIFGYESSNGEYTTNLEDKDSCNVKCKDEVAILKLDSNIVYKLLLGDNTNSSISAEYEYIKIDTPVVKRNDKLCASLEGIEKAFNVYIDYNEKTKKMNIYSLEHLLEVAEKKATKYNAKVDEAFVNKKAILDNMIVVNYEDNTKGVIDFGTEGEILGKQYENIRYISQKQAFLVQKDMRVGIYGSDGKEKITPRYNNLTLIDNENDLYMAEYEGRYGVVDINGQTKIYLDYDKIGVDVSDFKENGLRNGYVLLGKLIPVRQNEMWKFFRIEIEKNSDGTTNIQCKLIPGEFNDIGCISSTTKATTSNVMVIEDYDVVVVKKNNYYGFMDINGKPAIGQVFSDVYMETFSGITKYYMVSNEKSYNVIEELEKMGYSKVNKE